MPPGVCDGCIGAAGIDTSLSWSSVDAREWLVFSRRSILSSSAWYEAALPSPCRLCGIPLLLRSFEAIEAFGTKDESTGHVVTRAGRS